MSNPEIIGLGQLPVAPAETVTGDAMLVGVIDGKDVQIRASLLGVEGGQPPEGAVTSVAGKTGEVELEKADVGLGNVDNTADADKPLSNAAIQRFEVIESVLGNIDPDAGFNAENIIGRTEFAAAQQANAEALAALAETVPSVDGLVSSQQLTTALEPYVKTEDLPDAPDLSAFVTGEQLTQATSGLVTGEQLTQALEGVQSPDLSGYATNESVDTKLGSYVKTEDLPAAPDLSGLVTSEQLQQATQDLVTGTQLSEAIAGIQAPDLSGLATTEALEAVQQSIPSIEGLINGEQLATALQPYVKTEDLPAAPDLSGFATTEALQALAETIPSTEGLVTGEQLTTALQPYAKTEDLPSVEGLVNGQQLAEAVDPVNQAVQLLVQGLDTARLYWVNSGTDIESGRDGSIKAPFKQIQEALDALTPMTQSFVLLVVPTNAGANYEPFVADGFTNVTIQGFGCVDSHSVRIDGKNEIKGVTATRFRIKDVSMWNNDVNEPALVLNTPLNRHFFQNVTIQAINGTTAPIVDVQGDNSNWIDWNECNISGRVKLAASTHNAIFAMRDSNSDTCHVESDGGWKIRVANATRMGSIESLDDQVELNNVVGWTGKAGVAVKHASDTRPLTIHGCNFQKPDNGYLTVEKTGTVDYQLSATNINPTMGVWNGVNKAYERPASYYQPVPEATLVDLLGNGAAVEGLISWNLNGYPSATLRYMVEAQLPDDSWEALIDQTFNATVPNQPLNVTPSGEASHLRLSVSDPFNPNFNLITHTLEVVRV